MQGKKSGENGERIESVEHPRSGESANLDSKTFLQYGRVVCVPSFHSRLEFALHVRKAFFQLEPVAICVELPDLFANAVIDAVNHLPHVTL